jgi:hypothetical protein
LRRPGADRCLCVIGRVACLAACGRTEIPRLKKEDFVKEIRCDGAMRRVGRELRTFQCLCWMPWYELSTRR